MRNVDLHISRPQSGHEALVAQLTRHLEDRLLDFDPGGPEVLDRNPYTGFVAARFPGHETGEVLEQLLARGVSAAQETDRAVFYLSPDIPFEDLDYVWGCLFDILY